DGVGDGDPGGVRRLRPADHQAWSRRDLRGVRKVSALVGAAYLPQAEAVMASAKEWLRTAWRAFRRRAFGASLESTCVVLIDGDNVPARMSGAIVEFASSIGL